MPLLHTGREIEDLLRVSQAKQQEKCFRLVEVCTRVADLLLGSVGCKGCCEIAK